MYKKKRINFWVGFIIVCGLFVVGTVSVFFGKYNADFFSNIFLSLTISQSGVIDDGDDDGGTDNVGSGGGTAIIRVEIPAILNDEKLNPTDVMESDSVTVDFVDEINGIGISEQFVVVDSLKVDSLVLSVPLLPSMNLDDVVVPVSPAEDYDVSEIGSRISFNGVTEPYSYLLLEISSRPNIVTLFAGADGKWNYNLPYDLPDGLHHLYVWSFSKDGKTKTMIASKAFYVNSTLNNDDFDFSNIYVDPGVLKASIEKSSLVSSLGNQAVGGQMFYINGRILNDLNQIANDDKLAFVIFVKPLFDSFEMTRGAGLKFVYRIYNSSGVLMDTVSEDGLRYVENGELSFTKTFSFISSEKFVVGDYRLIVEAVSDELSYWLPLNFEIIEAGAVNSFKDYRGVLFGIGALVLFTGAAFYLWSVVPRFKGRGK